MMQDLLPTICKNCVDDRDKVLKYVDDIDNQITCSDSSCTKGKWVDCVDSDTVVSDASKLFADFRLRVPTPPMAEMINSKNETLCGESNQVHPAGRGFNRNKYCPLKSKKSCCKHFPPEKGQRYSLNDTCVEKSECDPYKWFDVDLNDYKQAEACRWKLKNKKQQFKILKSQDLREKLKGKKVFIIGDSHSRGMYVSLVSMATEIFGNLLGEAIHFKPGLGDKCRFGYHFYHNEICRETFDFDYYDVAGNFSIHWKTVWGKTNFSVYGIQEEDYWIWTQGMHQNYEPSFAINGIKDLRVLSKRGTFITPPTPSFIHAPEHRLRQRPSKLKELAKQVGAEISSDMKEIRLIRYDELTEFVDAVDGVHYGYNVFRVLLSIYVNGLH